VFRFRNGEFSEFSSGTVCPATKFFSIVPDTKRGVSLMSSDNGIFGIKRSGFESYIRGTSPPLLCQRLSFLKPGKPRLLGVVNRSAQRILMGGLVSQHG